MNILVVCQHYWPEPFNVSETCEMLIAQGHEVTVLTGLPNYPQGVIPEEYKSKKARLEYKDGVEIRRSWIYPRGENLKGINKLKRVINYLSFPLFASRKSCVAGFDYDIVLSMQFSPVLMAVPALVHAKRKNVPCIIYCFDLWPEDLLTGGMTKQGLPYRIMKHVSKYIYSKADLIVVTSPDFIRYFNEVLGLREQAYAYLPQYAETMFEEMAPAVKGDIASTAEKANDDITNITFAGNIGGNQSIENVVRAAALLNEEDRIRIHIIGSGSRLESCKSLAADLGATSVVFHGRKPLEEMPAYYQEADAMLLPLAKAPNGSLVTQYTIPRKIQSYLAAGKPILVSADGAAAKLVDDALAGFSCQAENPECLAEVFRAFASLTAEEKRQMAKNAAKLYEESFSQERYARSLDRILRSVV